MKKVSVLALTAILVLSVAAVAVAQTAQENPSSSTKSMRGTIVSVDNGAKSFVVKDANGQESTVYWNDTTRLSGELAAGAAVVIQTSTQDGKTVATAVQVSGAKKPY